ncbi:unnamed protein product [Alopecurus aequalis]
MAAAGGPHMADLSVLLPPRMTRPVEYRLVGGDGCFLLNLGSDFFVVKGVGIGHEAVSAQLFEPQFEHVNDTITLTVAEAMSLEPPSPVLVTLGVTVNFKLKIFREKVAQGCGKTMEDYKLYSSDESVVSVSDSRTVRAKKPGQAVIKVVSVFDFLNFDEVIIEVSTPSALAILPIFPVEVAVGTQLHAAVTFKTSNGHSYSRCDYFNAFIRWSLLSENQTFEVVDTAEALSVEALKHHAGSWKQHGNPCAWISLNASAAGRATIVATFSSESESYLETLNVPIFLKATSKVSAYYPLLVLQAGNGNQFGGYWFDLSRLHSEIENMGNNSPMELYLVPGSTMDVFLFGGPEKWDQVVDFVETVDVVGEPTGSTAVQKKLLFSRGNMIGKDHPVPAVAKSELSIVCDLPSTITLIANENVKLSCVTSPFLTLLTENRLDILEVASKADRSPSRLQLSPVVISNGRIIRLAAAGVHGNGRFFANSSSLDLRWDITECEGLAYLDQDEDAETLDKSSWERFLVLQNSTGLYKYMGIEVHLGDEILELINPSCTSTNIFCRIIDPDSLSFSVDDNIELDVKYADELGYIFHEALGIAPVKVETNYPDVVSIFTPRDGNGTHQRFVLQVSVGARMYPMEVVIHPGQHLDLAVGGDGHQTEEVKVDHATGDRTEPSSSSGLTTFAVILSCIAIPAATLAIFMKLLERPARRAPPRHTGPAPAAAGPAAVLDPASPRTPQPFMEYVRKTVDDTPYYKRDGRRRFNPQNTY